MHRVAGQVLLMEELLRLLRLASSQHLTLDALEAELRQVVQVCASFLVGF